VSEPIKVAKTRFRLNGWQRIGVVLSCCWAIAVCGIFLAEKLSATAKRPLTYEEVIKDPNFQGLPPIEQEKVLAALPELAAQREMKARKDLLLGTLVVFVPILTAWLAVYAIIAIVKWVRKGFAQPTGSKDNA